MEPSNLFNSIPLLYDSFPWLNRRTGKPRHDHQAGIGPPQASEVLPQEGKAAAPFPPSCPSLRIALVLNRTENFQTLSLLEQLPGVDIVGIAEHPLQDQEFIRKHEYSPPCGPSSKLVLDHTAPHVLLNLANATRILAPEHPEHRAITEIPGPYTTSLLEKITEHKQTVARQMSQIEQLATIGTMTSGILHNISNPLYVILGYSELLLEDMPSPAAREQVMEILQAVKRIITMCKDLNLYARQSTSATCTTVHLIPQLEEALKVARFSVGMENMTIIRQYAAHPKISGRTEDIVQIFVNLIMNAIQAMEGQGILTLEAGSTDERAIISIKDNGPGIPPAYKEKIFEPFFTTKPPGQGTGLGLHSVRSLIHLHGGQIFLESSVGEGTVFHLEFPLMSEPECLRTA